MSAEQCNDNDLYTYAAGKQCLDANACHEAKGYAYAATMSCDTVEPDEKGKFDTKMMEDHVYQCADEDDLLDTVSAKRKCVSDI